MEPFQSGAPLSGARPAPRPGPAVHRPKKQGELSDPYRLALGLLDPSPGAMQLKTPVDWDARLRASDCVPERELMAARADLRLGDYRQAAHCLVPLVDHPEAGFHARRLLLRCAAALADGQLLRQAAVPLIEHYVEQGLLERAAVIYVRARRVDCSFRPGRPDCHRPLASVLAFLGRDREALALAADFHKWYPNHPDLGPLYMLAANVLRRHGQSGRALKIVRYLLARRDCAGDLRNRLLRLRESLALDLEDRAPGVPGR